LASASAFFRNCRIAFACRRVLLDQVFQQLAHLFVELGSVNWSRMMVLRTLLMMPSAMALLGQLALLVELAGNGIVDASLDDELGQRHLELEIAQGTSAGSAWM
jgi:hypothetical protein